MKALRSVLGMSLGECILAGLMVLGTYHAGLVVVSYVRALIAH